MSIMSDALYERFDSNEAFQHAVDRIFAEAGRELRIFDPDGVALRLNEPASGAALERCVRKGRTGRLYLVQHDPEPLQWYCPRMMVPITRFGHAIQVYLTQESFRQLQ